MSPNATFFFELLEEHGLPESAREAWSTLYEPVLEWLVARQATQGGPIRVGVNGAQGSGKTTFCSLLVPLLERIHNLRAATLSIDDVYATRANRMKLGETLHPLCAIRGVPGTHDIPLAHSVLEHITALAPEECTTLPRFDKARDDRRARSGWEPVEGPIDILFFEGWCVGCPPLPPWEGPINSREAREDPKGTWMRWSMNALETEYGSLFSQLDALLFIAVPSMETVRESRWLQEKKLRDSMARNGDTEALVGLMTQEEVLDYVELFERYTEHMLRTLPELADVHICRDPDFRYTVERVSDPHRSKAIQRIP